MVEAAYVSGVDAVQGGIVEGGVTTRIIPLRGPARDIEPWKADGGHGGGDVVMLADIFLPEPPADKYLRASDERGGAASILVGIAANRCFETHREVKISELLPKLPRPDYAPMPSRDAAIPMPVPVRV
jgi:hypothetical protein